MLGIAGLAVGLYAGPGGAVRAAPAACQVRVGGSDLVTAMTTPLLAYALHGGQMTLASAAVNTVPAPTPGAGRDRTLRDRPLSASGRAARSRLSPRSSSNTTSWSRSRSSPTRRLRWQRPRTSSRRSRIGTSQARHPSPVSAASAKVFFLSLGPRMETRFSSRAWARLSLASPSRRPRSSSRNRPGSRSRTPSRGTSARRRPRLRRRRLRMDRSASPSRSTHKQRS